MLIARVNGLMLTFLSDVSRPVSYMPIGHGAPVPFRPSYTAYSVPKPETYAPQILTPEQTPKQRHLLSSNFSAVYPCRSNTVGSLGVRAPHIPRSKALARNPVLEKELPPPPPLEEATPRNTKPSVDILEFVSQNKPAIEPEAPEINSTRQFAQRSTSISHADATPQPQLPQPFLPTIDPNDFPKPQKTNHTIRQIQSIDAFPGPQYSYYTSPADTHRPGTASTNKPFHKRLFSMAAGSSKSESKRQHNVNIPTSPSIHSGRRLSRVSTGRETHTTEDPLAPVMVMPVKNTTTDGLAYLPRHTNGYAGFCKSMFSTNFICFTANKT